MSLIKSIAEKNHVESKKEFNKALAEKVNAKLTELAESMYSGLGVGKIR